MEKTLVIGSACADVSLYVDHLPGKEEDIHPLKQKISLGGCAANAAGIMRLFDVPVLLYAPVGTGLFGSFVENELKKRGMEPALKTEEENGACYCLVDQAGDRTFIAMHGAEYRFRKEWFDDPVLDTFDQIYVCGLEIEEETGENIIAFLQKHADRRIIFAPGPRILSIPEEKMNEILQLHPLVHCNRREASSYFGHPEYTSKKCAEELYKLTGNTVIITDGADPCVYIEEGKVYTIPGEKADAIDGTGAGDAHIGSVMAMLAQGKTMAEAVRMANCIGAAVCMQEGTQLPAEIYMKIRKEKDI